MLSDKSEKVINTIAVISAISLIGLPIAFICLGILTLDDIWN